MVGMVAPTGALTTPQQDAARGLAADLGRVFGGRLQAVVAYGIDGLTPDQPLHTLALVDRCTFDDLAACAGRVARWSEAGLSVPLVLTRDEFIRSLDAFPLEYGSILAWHVLIAGADPFTGVAIADADRRRECERRAKSHLIHLREGYLEAGGQAAAVAALVQRSAAPFRHLLSQVAQLHGVAAFDDDALAAFAERVLDVRAALIREVFACGRAPSTIVDPSATFGPYVEAAERIWSTLDTWSAS
jgi:hypothetical protein